MYSANIKKLCPHTCHVLGCQGIADTTTHARSLLAHSEHCHHHCRGLQFLRERTEYKVLVVVDPQAALISAEDRRCDWSFQELSEDEADAYCTDPDFKGWIRPEDTGSEKWPLQPGNKRVYINEWAYFALRWRKFPNCRMTTVDFKPASWFIDQVLDDDLSASLYNSYDCLVGGLDLSQDIGPEHTEFIRDRMSTNNRTQLNQHRAYLYTAEMKYINGILPCWPPVVESLFSGHKGHLVSHLDWIATNITYTHRPKTTILKEEFSLPLSGVDFSSVLKREGSNGGRHVLFPHQVAGLDAESVNAMARHPQWKWLIQEYVPYFQSVGEWRLVMVKGKVSYGVVTEHVGDGLVNWSPLNGQFSLAEMHNILNSPQQTWQSKNITVRKGGTTDARKFAQNELYRFAETTLASLVQRQWKALDIHYLGIELLCRMDISIINAPDRSLHYFVNEIAAGGAAIFYSDMEPSYHLSVLADDLADCLPIWLDDVGYMSGKFDQKTPRIRY